MYIIGNGTVVTRNAYQDCFHGAVATKESRIIALGDCDELKMRYPSAKFIDAKGGLILPGFINLGLHSLGTLLGLLRSYFKTEGHFSLFDAADAFERRISRCMTLDTIAACAYKTAEDCIKSGITTVFVLHSSPNDISGSLQTLSSVFRDCGIRCALAYDVDENYGTQSFIRAVNENRDFYDYTRALNTDMLKSVFSIAPGSGLSDEALKRISNEHINSKLFCSTARNAQESFASFSKYKSTPIERLSQYGLLNGDSLVNCSSELTKRETQLLIEHDCTALISTESDLMMGIKPYSLSSLSTKGIRIGSGSRFGSVNILTASRTMLMNELALRQDVRIPPIISKALFVTNAQIASETFGIKTGVLDVGAAADIVIVSANESSLAHDLVISDLLHNRSECDCIMTMANGKVLMQNGEFAEHDAKRARISFDDAVTSIINNLS